MIQNAPPKEAYLSLDHLTRPRRVLENSRKQYRVLLYQAKCNLGSISCCRVLGQNRPWWETPEVLLGGIDFRPSFARGSFIGAPLNLQDRLAAGSVGYSPAAPLRSGRSSAAPARTNLKRIPPLESGPSSGWSRRFGVSTGAAAGGRLGSTRLVQSLGGRGGSPRLSNVTQSNRPPASFVSDRTKGPRGMSSIWI